MDLISFLTPPAMGHPPAPRRRPLVIIESPYAGNITHNVNYARAAVKDSLLRGEAPMASHLLYTQPGILDDLNAIERAWGIDAGLAWRHAADKAVFYADLGWSSGMQQALDIYQREGKPYETRMLGIWEWVA